MQIVSLPGTCLRLLRGAMNFQRTQVDFQTENPMLRTSRQNDNILLIFGVINIPNIMFSFKRIILYLSAWSVCREEIQQFQTNSRNTVCPQSPLGVLKNYVLCSTLCIVERESNNSREARRMDFVGLRTNV
jgi:hypothetical protein